MNAIAIAFVAIVNLFAVVIDNMLGVEPRSSFSIPFYVYGYQNKAYYGIHELRTFGCHLLEC